MVFQTLKDSQPGNVCPFRALLIPISAHALHHCWETMTGKGREKDTQTCLGQDVLRTCPTTTREGWEGILPSHRKCCGRPLPHQASFSERARSDCKPAEPLTQEHPRGICRVPVAQQSIIKFPYLNLAFFCLYPTGSQLAQGCFCFIHRSKKILLKASGLQKASNLADSLPGATELPQFCTVTEQHGYLPLCLFGPEA